MATASSTQRRAARRKRAGARRAWFLHNRGIIRLQPHRLGHLWKILKHHHSKDPVFLDRIRQAMAHSGQQGWYCATCRKMRSPQAYYCDLCGQAWEQCMGQPGAHRVQQSASYGQNAGWQGHQPQQRTKSPRTKNRPRSRKKSRMHSGLTTIRTLPAAIMEMLPGQHLVNGRALWHHRVRKDLGRVFLNFPCKWHLRRHPHRPCLWQHRRLMGYPGCHKLLRELLRCLRCLSCRLLWRPP